MKEVKFRSYNTETKKMYYDFDQKIKEVELGKSIHLFVYETGLHFKSLMQYIGIKDIKNNDVYEGDILEVGENLIAEIVFIGLNTKDYGDEIHSAFHAKVYRHDKIIPIDSYFHNNCKVIGNIYENKELLQ